MAHHRRYRRKIKPDPPMRRVTRLHMNSGIIIDEEAGRSTIRDNRRGVTVEAPTEAVTFNRDGSIELAPFDGPVTTTWTVA